MKQALIILFIILTGSLFLCIGTSSVHAATSTQAVAAAAPTPGYGLINPLGSRSIPLLAADLIKWLSGLAGTAFMIYLLWGGLQWMTSGGDAKKTLAARNRMLYAILGIVIIFLAYFLIDALIGVTNIQF
jgi:hypothetical protein